MGDHHSLFHLWETLLLFLKIRKENMLLHSLKEDRVSYCTDKFKTKLFLLEKQEASSYCFLIW